MFCGAGGSTLGALQAGATPVLGMNHWTVACDSYEANHAEHGARAACVDVVTQDPRRYPGADMLLASPECTHHSYARGKPKDDPSLFDPAGGQGAERSRATMWDVVRFAEVHGYRIVIVENVEAAVKWGLPRGRKLTHGQYGALFASWLGAMGALDYEHQLVHLNSMTCGVPQSRDRLYVVFWKRGQRRPDLEMTAPAWCPACDELVQATQRWKRPGAVTGTLGQGYTHDCPSCGTACALAIVPAAAAIDWSLPAVKIGDRGEHGLQPLRPNTLERVRRGLPKLRERPATIALPGGLVVQLSEGDLLNHAAPAGGWSTDTPATASATADRALVLSNMTHNVPRRAVCEPAATVTSGGKLALVVEQRGTPHRPGGANAARLADQEVIGTVSAQGKHHALVIANYGGHRSKASQQGWARHVDDSPTGTITATDSHALLTFRKGMDVRSLQEPVPTLTTLEHQALLGEITDADVDACTFRMLQPHELKLASGFGAAYILHGTKRDQVAQVGNAVSAPAEAELVRRCLASLEPV